MASTENREDVSPEPANGRRPARRGREDNSIDWTVFGWAFGCVVVFCILGAIWPSQVGGYATAALNWVMANLGWLFILAATGFVGFSLYLAFSRYGRIPVAIQPGPAGGSAGLVEAGTACRLDH
ncbi:MAG: BCCT family transporter [Nocardioidaceae bacterium]